MAMPAGVQKQVDRANQLIKEIGLAPPDPAPAASTEGQPPAPAAAPVAPQGTPPSAPEVVPPVAAPPQPVAVAPPPPPPPAPPVEDWEHKYRVLQGKYDNEVPRLSKQIGTLTSQVENMQRQLTAPPAPNTPPAAKKLVTPQEIEEFGPELVDLIGRRAQEVYEPIVNDLRAQVTGLSTQLKTTGEEAFKQARAKLIDALAQRVPNYLELNNSPLFLDWLDLADAYSGEMRGQMLKRAYDENDTERVIRFFTGFLSEHAAISPQPNAGSSPGTPRLDLGQHIAPGTSTIVPNVNGAQGEKRIWRQPEIAAFYAAVNHGVFKKNPDERVRIESDIIAAGREGRVRA